jgi:hypothetical protein
VLVASGLVIAAAALGAHLQAPRHRH